MAREMSFEEFRSAVGKKIRKRRRDLEYSVSDVAMGTGLLHPTIEKWEGGRACPRLDMAQKLCRFLECSVDEIMP